MAINENDTRAVRLPPNHEKVQYLMRRYMYCLWRMHTATKLRYAKRWRVAEESYGKAITRILGTDDWEFPYKTSEARRSLVYNLSAIPKIASE